MYNVDDAEEEVLGYFEVASGSVIRFVTFRSDIPFEQALECQYDPGLGFNPNNYRDYCINCLLIRNSTLIRPDFF